MTLRSNLLLAAALVAVAGQASATTATFPNNGGTTTTDAVFGGGSSLVAPYFRQSADCWGDKIDLASRGSSTTTSSPDFNYTGLPPFNCSTQEYAPGSAVSYISTGSGRGLLGYFAHTPFYVDPIGMTGDDWLGNGTGGTTNAPSVYATKVDYAASDAGIPQTDPNGAGDIDSYNGTTAGSPAGHFVTNSKVTIAIRGSDGSAPAGYTSGPIYDAPRVDYGSAIQIPLLVAVVDVAFAPVYKKVASAQGVVASTSFRNGKSGGVKLSNTQLCNIFTGADTNLGQDGLATTFGAATADLPNAANIPVEIVGRNDSSGTTSIFYRHVEKLCGGAYTTSDGSAPLLLPTALQGPTYDGLDNRDVTPQAGKFTLANGSGGVAKYLAYTHVPTAGTTDYQFRIGYIGNDFVLPAVLINGNNGFNLVSAALLNSKSNTFVAASPAAGLKGVTTLPPQTTSAGVYSPLPNLGSRANAAALTTTYTWVSASNIASPLADPQVTAAYPLVGTTNGLFYQCYASSDNAAILKSFLGWYFTQKPSTDPAKSILALNGLSPVSPAYQKAINETFVTNPTYLHVGTPTGPAGKLNLDINSVGTNPECTGVSTGA